jgi:hypothetical protein
MSDDWATVFPTDPRWIPSPDRAAAAVAVYDALMDGEAVIEVRGPGPMNFESALAEFGTATCPECATQLASNPGSMSWLTEQLDRVFAADDEPDPLAATMPCCGAVRSLNDVVYDPPAGFASWSVSARNPAYRVDDHVLRVIAAALGHDVKVVEGHL